MKTAEIWNEHLRSRHTFGDWLTEVFNQFNIRWMPDPLQEGGSDPGYYAGRSGSELFKITKLYKQYIADMDDDPDDENRNLDQYFEAVNKLKVVQFYIPDLRDDTIEDVYAGLKRFRIQVKVMD